MLIEMKVASLTVDPFSNMPVVLLEDLEGKRRMPLWIGMGEAKAIQTELENIHLDRPVAHDLMKTILGACSANVDRVEVHDLKNDTFYASLYLRRPDGSTVAIDARPSDALALALRTGAAIYVADKVIQLAGRTGGGGPEPQAAGQEPAVGVAEGLRPARGQRLRQMEDVRPASRWLAWIPPALWALAIVVASSIPARQMPAGPIFGQDKLLHFAAYFGLGALVMRAWPRYLAVLALVSLFGVTDELHQLLTPGRACDVFDWLADVAGAATGSAAALMLHRLRRAHGDRS
jgi:uncharacterized protein